MNEELKLETETKLRMFRDRCYMVEEMLTSVLGYLLRS